MVRKEPETGRPKIVWLALGALGVLVVVLLVAGGRSGTSAPKTSAPSAPSPSEESTAAAPARAAPRPEMRTDIALGNVAIGNRLRSVDQLTDLLVDYEEAMQYPPWSRPLTPGMRDIIHWQEAPGVDVTWNDLPGKEATLVLRGDPAHVVAGKPMITTVEVITAADQKRAPLKVLQALVLGRQCARPNPIATVEFRDDGQGGDEQANDNVWTNTFVPSEDPVLRQKSCSTAMTVEVEAAGVTKMATRTFSFSPRKVLQVSKLSEAVVDGNLEVTMDVAVEQKGYYWFLANLFSSDGKTPVAFFKDTLQLEAGTGKVKLKFFGKVLRDSGVEGQYLVRDVRGYQAFPETSDPEIWWSSDETLLTKRYAASELSDAVWDSPEKRGKIEWIQELIADARKGGQPQAALP